MTAILINLAIASAAFAIGWITAWWRHDDDYRDAMLAETDKLAKLLENICKEQIKKDNAPHLPNQDIYS